MHRLGPLLISLLVGLIAIPAWAEIPYRYPVQEGFIVTVDGESRRSLQQDDPVALAALDALATLLVSDTYRIPVEYGRTLAWNEGERLVDGMNRDQQRELYKQARSSDASRPVPATIMFLRLALRDQPDGTATATAWLDLVDVTRGDVKARYVSDPIVVIFKDGCSEILACKARGVASALIPFFQQTADQVLQLLGPAPPRGYGDVPPAWLIEAIRYRVDFRDLPDDIRADAVDAMQIEFPYYLASTIERDEPGRFILTYETQLPSWWLADRLMEVFADLAYAAKIEPRPNGLRISPAE
ncbi:MAG: hypothetical protein P1V34_18095 [Alphaproteobacteria bacterium]|nr:hypothetical protein [Alphaproteobacteria bacterium]